jgi:protocatechuate 3,4-dioxygenase beta subunit
MRAIVRAVIAGVLVAVPAACFTSVASGADAPSGPASSNGTVPVVRLCEPSEAGKKLSFGGRVLDMDGRPLAKAAVVAYQTDALGYYNPPGSNTRVPRIRGVAVTAEDGSFRFETIRPGAYPEGGVPSHIHLIVAAPVHRTRYLEYWFEDDPLLTADRRRRVAGNDDFVIVAVRQDAGGAATFRHDIALKGN